MTSKEFVTALNEALANAVCATFEATAFIDTVRDTDPDMPQQFRFDNCKIAEIRISASNPLIGKILLCVPNTVLEGIASLLLHVEAREVTSINCEESCMEILNIVAGDFCRRVVSSDGLFELGLPAIINKQLIPKELVTARGVFFTVQSGEKVAACFLEEAPLG